MTTLAYRPGRLAADTQITGGGQIMGYAAKIGVTHGILHGAIGTLAYIQAFNAWVRAGMKDSPPIFISSGQPDRGFIFHGRRVLTYSSKGIHPDLTEADFHAFGSGAEYALGAMAMGYEPEVAVRAAMRFDTNSGGRVIRLDAG